MTKQTTLPDCYFPYKNNVMLAENVELSAIAKEVGTPFYCYSSQAITNNFTAYQQAFSE